ncbi:uncharacterized protein isoform X1 [Musca autumnalis]|uniref:uncharacterized protein isoform X1 n=1 Tax=Musca autumnalis TaxID=221902 RepID=UPI003CEF632A
MSQKNSCRLCVKWCENFKSLYDDSGQPNALYEIIVKYFHPTVLNIEKYTYLHGICRQCWIHIKEFTTFQKSIKEAQINLLSSFPEFLNDAKLEEDFECGNNADNIQFVITSNVNIKDEFDDNEAGVTCEEYLEDDYNNSPHSQQYETNIINIEELSDGDGGNFEGEGGESILLNNDETEDDEANQMELLRLQNEFEQQQQQHNIDEMNAASGSSNYNSHDFQEMPQTNNEIPSESQVAQDLYHDPWNEEMTIVAEDLPFGDGSHTQFTHDEGQEVFNPSTDTGQATNEDSSIVLLNDEYQLEPAMIFKCKFCGYFWKSKKELKSHVMQQHREQLRKNRNTPQTSSSSTTSNNRSLLQAPKERLTQRPAQHNSKPPETLLKESSHHHQPLPPLIPKKYILNKDLKTNTTVSKTKSVDDFKLLQLECKACTKCFNTEKEFNGHRCIRTIIKPRTEIAVGKRTFKIPVTATKMLQHSKSLQNKSQSSSSSASAAAANAPSWIYACAFCPKSYSTYGELNHHREKEHPLEQNTKYLKILR